MSIDKPYKLIRGSTTLIRETDRRHVLLLFLLSTLLRTGYLLHYCICSLSFFQLVTRRGCCEVCTDLEDSTARTETNWRSAGHAAKRSAVRLARVTPNPRGLEGSSGKRQSSTVLQEGTGKVAELGQVDALEVDWLESSGSVRFPYRTVSTA